MFIFPELLTDDAQIAFPEDAFQGIDFLVGGTWISERKNAPAYVLHSETLDLQFNHRFLVAIASVVETSSPTTTHFIRGYIGVDLCDNRLVMRNFTTNGSYAQGTQTGGIPGSEWSFAGTIGGPQTVEWRNTITKVEEDTIVIASVVNGKPETSEFRRTR